MLHQFVDDGAIVEDGGEVVVEVNIFAHQLSWFQTELWLLHQFVDGAIVEDGGEVVVEVNCCSISSCCGVRQSCGCCLVVDDGAIVEDGGEVLWKSILLLHQ